MGRNGRTNGDGVAHERVVVVDGNGVSDGAVWEAHWRPDGDEGLVDLAGGSVVARCESCGLGYELLGVGGSAGDLAGSCGDCGGSLYLLEGFSVEGPGGVDRYDEGFAAGFEAGWDWGELLAEADGEDGLAVEGGLPDEVLLGMDLDELEALYSGLEAGS
jgi:hypothetical protein